MDEIDRLSEIAVGSAQRTWAAKQLDRERHERSPSSPDGETPSDREDHEADEGS